MYLSIILPYFKKKKYIKRTLNSIISQSFKKHQLIIVYDQADKSDIPYIKGILENKIKYKERKRKYLVYYKCLIVNVIIIQDWLKICQIQKKNVLNYLKAFVNGNRH